MSIKEFINANNIEYCSNCVSGEIVTEIEKSTDFKFGKMLKEYIVDYGYLAFKHIEFYGINATQKETSDMIAQTKYLNNYYPDTKGYIALENLGEGDYVIVDKNDNVYEYDTFAKSLKSLEKNLFAYIQCRFSAQIGE